MRKKKPVLFSSSQKHTILSLFSLRALSQAILILLLWFALATLPFEPLTVFSADAHARDEALENREMTANLDGMALKEFILFISRFTGSNIVFREDHIPAATITMHTSEPMSEPELLAVFESILAGNNLELISRDEILYILPGPIVQGVTDPFLYPHGPGENQELITTIIQLSKNTPVSQAAELLKPFISRYGLIQEVPPARAVLVRDTRQNINKISDIAATLQSLGTDWTAELIHLDQADAVNAASKIVELYQGLLERGRMGEAPVVLPVEWSNSLMVAGDRDQISTVQGLIDSLDSISERSTGLIIYPLKNARAETASEVLRELLSTPDATRDRDQGRLSTRMFVVSPDKETNSLLVLADPSMVSKVDRIVEHIDRPLSQVFVEALIVETTLEHSQDFGVEWLAGGGGADGIVTGGFVAPDSRLGPLLSRPAPPVAPGGFSVGALGNTITYAGKQFSTLGALVNFLKTATDFNILSTPQIMTLDNSEAEIFIGENRPYLVSERVDQNNNVIQSFDYRDVGIRLLVTPIINTESGVIRLDVQQEVKNVIDATDNLAPITMNRNTRTNVQLPSGSTMVISGLIENAFSQTRRAVPGISKAPGIGWLFRRERIVAPKSTLMVFLSARIIETLEQADELTSQRMDEVRQARQRHEEILEREFWGRSEKQRQSYEIDMNMYLPEPLIDRNE
ncbi:secretin N-terminal domain-containing protein [Desulfonatronovibrio magnus]|uniref:secretin N-terminal domain-containing protein n=1 Tax=Desulfonatronovibrio magnus TaxID=698827 RepID=UPI0005EAF0D4|nr:secretin N-terminal domain-containing protein [Desulfonatronovibrio magnus]